MDAFLHISEKYQEDISSLCQPLFALDLYNYFSYHCFKEGLSYGFCSNVEIPKRLLASNYQVPLFMTNGKIILNDGFYFMRHMPDLIGEIMGEKEREKFLQTEKSAEIDQSEAVFYFNSEDDFAEVFFFGVFPPKGNVYYSLCQSLGSLREFIPYILDHGRKLFSIAEKHHEVVPIRKLTYSPSKLSRPELKTIKNFRFIENGKEIYLTKREYEFLSLYSTGITLEKCAALLDVKVRTVRAFYEAIKEKFSTPEKEHVLDIYSRSIYRKM